MLTFWIGTFLGEALFYLVPSAWCYRRIFSIVLGTVIIASTFGLLGSIGLGSWLLLGFLCINRLGNLLRIVKARMHQQYLFRQVRRTSLLIFLIHVLLLVVIGLPLAFGTTGFWNILFVLQFIVAAGILTATTQNIIKLKFKMPQVFLTDRELPTVTVAIPARNETADLEACLQSVLANDYPKLEILVLDDCSQTRTADIIRGFAQAGVRFIKGAEPAERWLAKNQAYQKLYLEATGDLILFCGADAQFSPQAIRSMVNLMSARHKSMLSVLPIRRYSSPPSVFIQPMRYWWELALPRRLFNKPAVISTCWMIGRSDLMRLGGFAAVSHAILPERYFAREMVKTDQYSFARSSAELQVETIKNFQEQYNTAIRTKYPLLRRHPENTLILTILSLIFLLGPFVGLVAGFLTRQSLVLPVFSGLLLITVHILIVNITDPGNSLLAGITFPVSVLIDIYLNYVSMIRYEFGLVEWKDRNICIPVMHTYPRLPAIPEK